MSRQIIISRHRYTDLILAALNHVGMEDAAVDYGSRTKAVHDIWLSEGSDIEIIDDDTEISEEVKFYDIEILSPEDVTLLEIPLTEEEYIIVKVLEKMSKLYGERYTQPTISIKENEKSTERYKKM